MRRWMFVAFVLLLIMLAAIGCSAKGPDGSDNTPPGPDPQPGNGDTTPPENPTPGNQSDAADVLPEPWLAYPGSMVGQDWRAAGIINTPGWRFITPPGTTFEDVLDYYLDLAEDRDDFSLASLAEGAWFWNHNEILIDYDHSNPDQIHYDIIFTTFND